MRGFDCGVSNESTEVVGHIVVSEDEYGMCRTKK